MMLGFFCEYKRHWFEWLPRSVVTGLLRGSVVIYGASMGLMFGGMEMKSLVVATGALLLAPCLLAYLFGRPMPGSIGQGMKWLGERTYSIYLWQQPFTICNYLPELLHPLGAIASVAVGGAWFRWFEWPFLTASRRATEMHQPSSAAGQWRWLGIGLTGITVVVGAAGWTMRRHYEERLAQQIDPASVPAFSVVAGPADHAVPTVLFLGDSRMAQWGLPKLAGWRVVNGAVDRLTSGQLRLMAPELLEKIHPDAVVLQAGVNDLKFLGLRPEMDSQIISLAASNLTAVAHDCVTRHYPCLVLEVWPVGRLGLIRRLIWNSTVASSVGRLNARLRAISSPAQKIRVADLFAESGLKPSVGLYYDTLHFRQEVYGQLTSALEKDLKALKPLAQ
jgi:lysophospholipase L1-like esterase